MRSLFSYIHILYMFVWYCVDFLLFYNSQSLPPYNKIVTYSRVELYNAQRVATLFGCGKTTLSEFTFEFVSEIKHDWRAVSFIFNDSILMIKRLFGGVSLPCLPWVSGFQCSVATLCVKLWNHLCICEMLFLFFVSLPTYLISSSSSAPSRASVSSQPNKPAALKIQWNIPKAPSSYRTTTMYVPYHTVVRFAVVYSFDYKARDG